MDRLPFARVVSQASIQALLRHRVHHVHRDRTTTILTPAHHASTVLWDTIRRRVRMGTDASYAPLDLSTTTTIRQHLAMAMELQHSAHQERTRRQALWTVRCAWEESSTMIPMRPRRALPAQRVRIQSKGRPHAQHARQVSTTTTRTLQPRALTAWTARLAPPVSWRAWTAPLEQSTIVALAPTWPVLRVRQAST